MKGQGRKNKRSNYKETTKNIKRVEKEESKQE
jgi:hypothetical protein